jgi:hypothetical protein
MAIITASTLAYQAHGSRACVIKFLLKKNWVAVDDVDFINVVLKK